MLANAFLALGERERACLVLVDGYRRTRSEPLRQLAEDLAAVPSTLDLDGPTPLPLIEPREESLDDVRDEARDVEVEDATVEEEEEIGEAVEGEEAIDVDEPRRMGIELALDEKEERPEGRLALHVSRPNPGTRSSNLRLIPGLEFAPLRHEHSTPRQSLASLMHEPLSEGDLPFPSPSVATPTPPPFPDTPVDEKATNEAGEKEGSRLPVSDSLSQAISELTGNQPVIPRNPGRIQELIRDEGEENLTPLEELARRLETARIPVVDEGDARGAVFEPSIVSDTLAQILVQQKAYAEAMKAFQTLARLKPEKLDYYQEKIEEMKFFLTQPGSGESQEEGE